MSSPLDPGVKDRARGALLGQLAGDALGTTVEFRGPEAIASQFPDGLTKIVGGGPFRVLPGQITDDSELALGLARALVRAGRFDPDAVAQSYLDWMRSGPFDVGGTIGAAFRGPVAAGKSVAAQVQGRTSKTSQANGSVMRVSPLAIFGWDLRPERLAELAAYDSRLSHPHPVCQGASVAFTHAIALAIREGLSGPDLYARTLAFSRERELHPDVLADLEDAGSSPPEDCVRNMGWVRIALRLAFFHLNAGSSVEHAVVDAVARGGDTDTNGCIVGALLGAAHGESAIPTQWVETVLACKTNRGPTYQNGDARELAEALAVAGSRPSGKEQLSLPGPAGFNR